MSSNGRLKSLVAISSAALLTLSLPATAATISGTKCAKVGATKTVSNFKYTCVKSGKKLLWNKGVKLAKTSKTTSTAGTESTSSTNTPTPTPSPSPTVKTPTLEDQILEYLDTVKVELAGKYQNLIDENLIPIEDIIDSESANTPAGPLHIESVQPARKFSSLFLLPNINSITLVIGINDVYVAGTVGDACQGIHDRPGSSCGPGFVYANLEAVTDNFKITSDSVIKNDPYIALSVWGNLPHEMWHQVQSITSENDTGLDKTELYPSWLREGGAEIAKLMTYAIVKNISYREAHNIYKKGTAGFCKNVVLDARNESYDKACEYTLGLYASEYLLWKTKDFNSLFAPSLNTSDTVESTFQSSYKFSHSDFLKEADLYIRSQN